MANPPPPYANISGITRTIMKDNQEETISNYDGNARPGELVVDLNNNNIYIGNTDGNLNLINTGGGSGNSEPAGAVGAIQLNAGGNLFGASANLSFANNTFTTANIIPVADNTYFLGDETHRWANLWLGPGTIYITDSNLASNLTAELTVLNGVLQVNGVPGLQANLISGNTSLTLAENSNVTITVAGSDNSWTFDDSNKLTTPGNVLVQDSNQNDIIELRTDGNIAFNGSATLSVNGGFFVSSVATSNGQGNIVTYESGQFKYGPQLKDYTGNLQANNLTTTGKQVVSTLYQDGGGTQGTATPIDLTKQVHIFADSWFSLADGTQGQVMYFAMNPGGSAEDIIVDVAHLRISQGGAGNTINHAVWHPFPYGAGNHVATLATAIFTDGAWSVSQGTIA